MLSLPEMKGTSSAVAASKHPRAAARSAASAAPPLSGQQKLSSSATRPRATPAATRCRAAVSTAAAAISYAEKRPTSGSSDCARTAAVSRPAVGQNAEIPIRAAPHKGPYKNPPRTV